MSSSRYEVGTVARRVPGTKMVQGSWSRQTLNIFGGAEPELGAPQVGQEDMPAPEQVPSAAPAPAAGSVFKPSTRIYAAPGGQSQVGQLFQQEEVAVQQAQAQKQQQQARAPYAPRPSIFAPAQEDEAAAPRPRASSRVLAAPGGSSSMSSLIFGGDAAPAPAAPQPRPEARAHYGSINLFGQPQQQQDGAPRAPASRRQVQPPSAAAESSQMGKVMAHQCEPEAPHGYRTAKVNASQNVVNLTPAAVKRATSRTARANEVSHSETDYQPCQERFAARQKATVSHAFSFADEMASAAAAPQAKAAEEGAEEQQEAAPAAAAAAAAPAPIHLNGKRSSRVAQVPGGRSSVTFF